MIAQRRNAGRIDRVSPRWDVRERHHRPVKADPQVTFDALRTVRPADVKLMKSLFVVRTLPSRLLGKTPPEPEPQRALLDLLLDSGFSELLSVPPDEIVVGQIAKFWQLNAMATHPVEDIDEFLAFDEPGWCKAAMNIRCRPAAGGCHIMTETRVLATDASARRKLHVYWAIVLPGSAIIRRNWLAAAARRAEGLGESL